MPQFVNVTTKVGNRSINLDLVRVITFDPNNGSMSLRFSETDTIVLDSEESAELQKTVKFGFPKPKASEPKPTVSRVMSADDLLKGAVPPSDQAWMR